MEHDKMDDSRWVDDRLSSLEPAADWRPNSSAALARVRQRDGAAQKAHRPWWLWATVSASAAAACALVFALLFSAPTACANPLGCKPTSQPAPAPVVTPAPVAVPAPAAVVAPAIASKKVNYKESGSPSALVTCEVYTDYECPHCATFYLETVPQLVKAYVRTGKIRLLHRDFPLPQHQYAMLAARYANASGELGYYDQAVMRLFRTQSVWSGDGEIEQQLAPALPGDVLAKVSQLVKGSPAALDASTLSDMDMGREDYLRMTPTVILVRDGARHPVQGDLTFEHLKKYVDEILERR